MSTQIIDKAILTALDLVLALYTLQWGWSVLWLDRVFLPPQVRLVLWVIRLLRITKLSERSDSELITPKENRLYGIFALMVGTGLYILGIMFLINLLVVLR